MARFQVEFYTDNAAFDDDARVEIARILRQLAAKCDDCTIAQSEGGVIVDVNGNRIGAWCWPDIP